MMSQKDLMKSIDEFQEEYVKKYGRLPSESEVVELVKEAKREFYKMSEETRSNANEYKSVEDDKVLIAIADEMMDEFDEAFKELAK